METKYKYSISEFESAIDRYNKNHDDYSICLNEIKLSFGLVRLAIGEIISHKTFGQVKACWNHEGKCYRRFTETPIPQGDLEL